MRQEPHVQCDIDAHVCTDEECGALQLAADAREQSLSDSIRDTCNTTAAVDALPRSKGKP